MKSLRNLLILCSAASSLLLTGTQVKADPLSLVITDAYQMSPAGDLLTFEATVTDVATSGTVYLNSDSTTLAGGLALDDSPFINSYPLSMDPGDTYTGELFTVSIPTNVPQGLYAGEFEILGGDPSDFTDVVASATFDVYVTPEPASYMLLLAGLVTIGAFGLRGISRKQLARQVA